MLKKLSPRQRMVAGFAALVALVVAVLGNSLYSLAHNKSEIRRLRAREALLEKEYEHLSQELTKLREQDALLLERIARTQYNMIKKGETQFRFAENDKH